MNNKCVGVVVVVVHNTVVDIQVSVDAEVLECCTTCVVVAVAIKENDVVVEKLCIKLLLYKGECCH